MKRYHTLSDQQRKIIVEKGTQSPGLDADFGRGVYTCARCDQPLFFSSDKFSSGCGWPSFDDEIEGAITRLPDADGRRTEILCSRCDGHLGHVFEGEGLTEKNLRHCVNLISLDFLPSHTDDGLERIVVAGGCFWGIQHHLKQLQGVAEAISGYAGGEVVYPSYEEVCTGKTGHLESVLVVFDPKIIDLEELLTAFVPLAGKGPDVGPQYASAIFVFTEEQASIAKPFGLSIRIASRFYPAEEYHQNYLSRSADFD